MCPAPIAAERRTQLGEGEAALHTVEHVLAAVAGWRSTTS
jgi:UDP-3-O-[3-hydroxymyristoyl] N-acetylglucosamine deacetylase / 3-hydroxyacyl-[acyl-carrier-protein] dehydratase